MRYLSPTLLAAQQASSGTPLISFVPSLGNTVLFQHYAQDEVLDTLYGVIVDSANPAQLFACAYSKQEAGTAWLAKLNSTTLDIISAVIYLDTEQSAAWYDIVQDDLYLYLIGYDWSGNDRMMAGKYLKSDLSKVKTVKWTTAQRGEGQEFNSLVEYGTHLYVVSDTTEGATALGGYIAEINKSDLAITADYYAEEAAGDGGDPGSRYMDVACDGTNVFAVGYEYGAATQGIVDKFDVDGLGTPTAKVVSYGTSVYFTGIAYDDTHLYIVGRDTGGDDDGLLIKLLKSDLSVVSAVKFEHASGNVWLNKVIVDGDKLYIAGTGYYDAGHNDAGLLMKINKSDLTIDVQQMYYHSDSDPRIFDGLTMDDGSIYTWTSAEGQSGSPYTGHRSIIKWNKLMVTTGTKDGYTVSNGALTRTVISPTTGASTRVLTGSGDSVTEKSYVESTSDVLGSGLSTISNDSSSDFDTTNRILAIVQEETPFGDTAEIILDNSDQYFSTRDLRGILINLRFGFGSETSPVPSLYVHQQEDISLAGQLFTRLSCLGNWNKLAMQRIMGDSISVVPKTLTDTVKEIIEARIFDSMALVVNTSDGEQDIKVPNASYEIDTDRRTIIRECNGLTGNLLFMRGADMYMIEKNDSQQHRITGTISGTFVAGETVEQAVTGATGKFVYQTATYIVLEAETGTFTISANQLSGDTATLSNPSAIDAHDYLYGPLSGAHTFYSSIHAQSLLTANRIIAVDALPDTAETNFAYSGEANDTDDQATFGVSTLIIEDPSISTDEEAATVAAARLLHIKNESVGGSLVAPMNCGQEIYDYVQVTDNRSGQTKSLRVSQIIRRYQTNSIYGTGGVYTIQLGFGGLTWDAPATFDLDLLVTVTEQVTRGPEGVIERPPKPPKQEPVPTGPYDLGRPSVSIGSLGGAVSREQYEASRKGVAQKLYASMTDSQLDMYRAMNRITGSDEDIEKSRQEIDEQKEEPLSFQEIRKLLSS